GQVFQGKLQFLATGQVDGEEVRIVLEPATGAEPVRTATGSEPASAAPTDAGTSPQTMEIRFTDFQRTSGLLGLPEGFVPEKVTLNVLEGETLRVTQDVALAEPS